MPWVKQRVEEIDPEFVFEEILQSAEISIKYKGYIERKRVLPIKFGDWKISEFLIILILRKSILCQWSVVSN